jgi:hypothetical protein
MKPAAFGRTALIGAMLYLAALSAGAADQARAPFSLPTPDGWRTETIHFPLGFAPELDYTGLEELRFAPGMFTPGAEDYWTYAFVWWISLDTDPGVERLQADLEAYFFGLTRVVARGSGFDPGNPTYEAKLRRIDEGDPGRLRGRVLTFDAFAARKPVELNVRVDNVACKDQGRRALVFLLSPRSEDHTVWRALEKIRDGFRCD